MNKFTKISVALLTAAVIFTGCGGNNNSNNKGKTPSSGNVDSNKSKETINKIPKERENKDSKDGLKFEKDGFAITFTMPKSYKDSGLYEEYDYIYAYSIDNGKANFNVVTEDIPSDLDINGYTDFSHDALLEDPNIKILDSISIKVGDFNGTETLLQNGELKQNQVYIIHEGKGYIFTYTGKEKYFEKYLDSYYGLLETVTVNGKSTTSSNTTKVDTADGVKFNRGDFGIRFSMPNNYKEVDYPEGGDSLVLYDIDNSKASFNVLHEDIPKNLDIEEYTKLNHDSLKTNPDIEIVTSVEGKVAGLDAIETYFLNGEYLQNQVYIVNNGKGYIFTFTSTEDFYDQYIGGFYNLLGTVEFK